jgi:hypothetical protein
MAELSTARLAAADPGSSRFFRPLVIATEDPTGESPCKMSITVRMPSEVRRVRYHVALHHRSGFGICVIMLFRLVSSDLWNRGEQRRQVIAGNRDLRRRSCDRLGWGLGGRELSRWRIQRRLGGGWPRVGVRRHCTGIAPLQEADDDGAVDHVAGTTTRATPCLSNTGRIPEAVLASALARSR